MNRNTSLLLLTLAYLLMTGTAWSQSSEREDWQKLPTDPGKFFNSDPELGVWQEVTDADRAYAISELKHIEFFRISSNTSLTIYKQELREALSNSRYIYLIRACRTTKYGGNFNIYRLGLSLYSVHGTLGSPGDRERTALILATSRPIDKVFTGCGGAK